MSHLTPRGARGIGFIVAVAVYVGAVGHDWALDDGAIILSNPASHTLDGALDAFFQPYWPTEQTASGQYRPLTIVSFAIDWVLSDGDPRWFHAVNVVMHGVVTLMVVSLALAWLPPLGAALAGIVFAIHPVHVEAVANVVGRAELLAAVGMLACLLAARRFRRSRAMTRRVLWLSAAMVSLAAALLSKEHAIVTLALLVLDEFLDPQRNFRKSVSLYVGTIAISLGWFYLWQAVAVEFVDVSAAATIRGLSGWQRLATVFPVQLEVVRLLVLPLDLAADYNPMIIPRRTSWSVVSTLGVLTSASIVMLGFVALIRRRAPAVAFGILAGVIAYAPTSNLVFASGIILAERNLYLPLAAPALIIGWLFVEATRATSTERPRWLKPAVTVCLSAAMVLFTVRTVTRIPFWQDGRNVTLMDFAEHSENYRARLRLGGFFRSRGNLQASLAETLSAGAMFPEDPWVAVYSVYRALDAGRTSVALAEAQRAYKLEPQHPSFARLVVRVRLAQGLPDSALAVARQSVIDAPQSPIAARSYLEVLDSLQVPGWRRRLGRARLARLEGNLAEATRALETGVAAMPDGIGAPEACWDAVDSIQLANDLRPMLVQKIERVVRAERSACRPELSVDSSSLDRG